MLKLLFHFSFIMISQNKKEKKKDWFLSVEDRSTFDKKWKRVVFHSSIGIRQEQTSYQR